MCVANGMQRTSASDADGRIGRRVEEASKRIYIVAADYNDIGEAICRWTVFSRIDLLAEMWYERRPLNN